MESFDLKLALGTVEWEEGKEVPLIVPSYRHRSVIRCTDQGRQKAEFANGSYPYFSYIQLLNNGEPIQKGVNFVPVLPDGRLIMVVEQRPAQFPPGTMPGRLVLNSKIIDLSQFGPYSSVEFPGGGVDPEEGLMAAFLRELVEESGVGEQKGMLYMKKHPCYPYGSDVSIQNFLGVVFLQNLGYRDHVQTDGGLHVLAVYPEEVAHNIRIGTITSGQAGLSPWHFYKEVKEATSDPKPLAYWKASEYIDVQEVKVSASKK